VAWAYVTSTGSFKGLKGGCVIKIGYPGMSDIIGQMRDGRLLAIEVKQPGQKPSKVQIDFIETVKRNNGLAGWATSMEEARVILDELA